MSAKVTAREHVNLHILTPERVLYEGQTLWVQVPLSDGFIGIWPGHAPLIGSLARGEIEWDAGHTVEKLAVESGILRVATDRCVILVGRSGVADRQAAGTGTEARFEGFGEALSDVLSEDEIDELQERQHAEGH